MAETTGFWAKYKWWVISSVALLAVAVAAYFLFFHEKKSATSESGGGWDPGTGTRYGGSGDSESGGDSLFYASKATKDLIATQKAAGALKDYGTGLGNSQWRWDVFCSQCVSVFGAEFAGCTWEQANGKNINGAKVLAWFHGMGVNPVTGNYNTTQETGYNGLFREPTVVADIKKFLSETYDKEAGKIYNSKGELITTEGWFLDKIK